MGKQQPTTYHRLGCNDDSAPICDSDCCKISHEAKIIYDAAVASNLDNPNHDNRYDTIHELLVVGAGIHSHALLLRLLSPEPDFLSEKQRHISAEFKDRMRSPHELRQYLKKLEVGPKATLKRKNAKKGDKSNNTNAPPPPLTLEEVVKSVLVVDRFGGWLQNWRDNFRALRIENLRSLMSAHNCPFDHRSLQYYARMKGREEELVTLTALNQRDPSFKGPYQVPSTSIFNDFHKLLSSAHGIENMVSSGTVLSIQPVHDEANTNEDECVVFEVKISKPPDGVRTVRTKRVVCALGPMFRDFRPAWFEAISSDLGDEHMAIQKILHPHQICPFINTLDELHNDIGRILVVGGGITSAQMALLASKSSWCEGVTLITRSTLKPRHFDIENKFMGPKRGKLLKDFHCLNMHERAKRLKEVRGGGTIPPELIRELRANQGSGRLQVLEEVEITELQWTNESFRVTLTGGCSLEESFDMIWLAVGADNHIDHYNVLSDLRKSLPIDIVNGLPVLGSDLSWQHPKIGAEAVNNEPIWKQLARKRIWCMGALAALDLGPDALNILGARHGSVRVAKAIRRDFEEHRMRMLHASDQRNNCSCC